MRIIVLTLNALFPLFLFSQNIDFAIFSRDTLHFWVDSPQDKLNSYLKSVTKSDPHWPVITPIKYYSSSSWPHNWTLTRDGKSEKNWQIERFYGLDKQAFLPPPGIALGNPILPNAARFLPQSILDTAFFRGHNHVVWQGKHCWMVNTSHGAIYYLTKNKVVKVAQIEHFKDYPAIFSGKRLFIEDRDKGELLFFSKITHLVPSTPLFKHRCLLDEGELRQAFGKIYSTM